MSLHALDRTHGRRLRAVLVMLAGVIAGFWIVHTWPGTLLWVLSLSCVCIAAGVGLQKRRR